MRSSILFSRGFSLIELMIVVTVAGVLMSIAIPAFSQWMANERLRASVSTLQVGFMRARSEAVRGNAVFSINANSGGWQNGWTIQDATNNILMTGGAVANVTVACSSTCPAAVSYNGSGRLSGGSSSLLRFSSPSASAQLCLSIAPSGLPEMYSC